MAEQAGFNPYLNELQLFLLEFSFLTSNGIKKAPGNRTERTYFMPLKLLEPGVPSLRPPHRESSSRQSPRDDPPTSSAAG